MLPWNSLALARIAVAAAAAATSGGCSGGSGGMAIPFGSPLWLANAGISCFLVLFAGIMSGLTLGLMSMGSVELEILQRSGTATDKRRAATILPVVKKRHQLLVALLLCNAAAMEALPLFLDKIFNPLVTVILSVTFVLVFGEVIPQAICSRYGFFVGGEIFCFLCFCSWLIPKAICSRYGLAVGAKFIWLVRILMVICYPVAYPIGKILDCALGHGDSAIFRRAQLKTLVSIHSKEAGNGGELSHVETTIISGALDMTEKTAEEAMTPIESTFSLDVNSKLDWEAFSKIIVRGHSRIPVYSENPRNIIGFLLAKSLLAVRAETEMPVNVVSIRRIPRVSADMPLYDILNEFQKGRSHIAAVVKTKVKIKSLPPIEENKSEENKEASDESNLTTPFLSKEDDTFVVDIDKGPEKQVKGNNPTSGLTSEDIDDGGVIGIITLEDVLEELLQDEIVDETDEYVDVHKRIRVAAVADASSVARAHQLGG